MIIVCATDRRYVEMTGVLIRSICVQAHRSRPEFFVFCSGLRPKDKADIARCVPPGMTIEFIDIAGALHDEIRRMPVKRHLSVTAYVSIYIPRILAERKGRILYLDSDVIVNTSLDPLFEIDLEGRSVGAAPDTTSPERLAQFNAAIGHKPTEPYFNSGVFVVDLEQWNGKAVTERGAAYSASRTGPILQHDQAVLNHVLKGDWTAIDPSWNEKPTQLTAEDAQSMPIQHFRGRMKPFYADYPAEYRRLYDQHRAHTPWARASRPSALRRSLDKRIRSLVDIWEGLRWKA